MRIWGRLPPDVHGKRAWVEVTTDPVTGLNDGVYLTWLAQVLQLNLNESPFYADWGIPAIASVRQQIPPDYYVALTQKRFAKYFAFLSIVKAPPTGRLPATPTYIGNVVTNVGYQNTMQVPT